MALYTFHLFAGGGGGILADLLLGNIPIGAVEIEEYARRILLSRQMDGLLPPFPIWDDVRTFRGDSLSGGWASSPTQMKDEREKMSKNEKSFRNSVSHNLQRWTWFRSCIFCNNKLFSKKFSQPYCSGGVEIPTPFHLTLSIATLNYWAAEDDRPPERNRDGFPNPNGSRQQEQRVFESHVEPERGDREIPHPGMGRVVNGMASWLDGNTTGVWFDEEEHGIKRTCDDLPNRVKRLEALGNGQVPRCAAIAQILLSRMEEANDGK